jgi:transposase-like protein
MQKLTMTDPQVVEFRRAIEDRLRGRVLEAIEEVLEEELEEALGCPRYERSSIRRGYRNGRERRRLTTALGGD